MASARKGVLSHGRTLYGILRSNLDQTLDCERTWADFFAGVTTGLPRSVPTLRYRRVNPNLSTVPALDEKDKIAELRMKTEESQKQDPHIQDIARQLIASSFYFETLSISDPDLDGKVRVNGKFHICCAATYVVVI